MRTFGLCASLVAVAQILAVSTPAFAQGGDPGAPAAPPAAPPAAADKPAADKPAAEDAKSAEDAAPAAEAAKPASAADGSVEVHIDAPQQVSLEKREAGGTKWEFVCTSPCDERQSVGVEYRIVGTDLNESKPFTLDGSKAGESGRIVLKVAPGVHNKAERGTWILVGGGALVVGGVAVLLLGANTKADGTGELPQANSTAIFAGSAMILAGLTGGILGASWLVDNRHTRVEGDVMGTTDERGGAPGGVKGEFKLGTSTPGTSNKATPSRTPTFSAPKTSGLPSFVSVPVFSTTF